MATPNIIRYLRIQLGIQVHENYTPIKLVNLILKKLFGLTVNKTKRSCDDRKQSYALNAEQVAKLLEYVKNRTEKRLLDVEAHREAA